MTLPGRGTQGFSPPLRALEEPLPRALGGLLPRALEGLLPRALEGLLPRALEALGPCGGLYKYVKNVHTFI